MIINHFQKLGRVIHTHYDITRGRFLCAVGHNRGPFYDNRQMSHYKQLQLHYNTNMFSYYYSLKTIRNIPHHIRRSYGCINHIATDAERLHAVRTFVQNLLVVVFLVQQTLADLQCSHAYQKCQTRLSCFVRRNKT